MQILENINNFEKKYDVSFQSYTLTGGDPLSCDNWLDLVRIIQKEEKACYILGIPEHINKTNIRLLESLDIKSYQVSLDGMQKTHDAIRGEGSFEKTIQALRELGQSKIDAGCMYTIHKKNVDEMFSVIQYLNGLETKIHFAFDFLVPIGNGKEISSFFDKEEAMEIFVKYLDFKEKLEKEGTRLKLHLKNSIFDVLKIKKLSPIDLANVPNMGCSCGIAGISILPNGDVLPCRRLPIVVGNLLKDSFEKVFFENELLRKMRRVEYYLYCKSCYYNKICRGCPALSWAYTQNPFEKYPYCSVKEISTMDVKETSLDLDVKDEVAFWMERNGSSDEVKFDAIFKKYKIMLKKAFEEIDDMQK